MICRPRAILDIIKSGESFRISIDVKMPEQGVCERCGYISSQVILSCYSNMKTFSLLKHEACPPPSCMAPAFFKSRLWTFEKQHPLTLDLVRWRHPPVEGQGWVGWSYKRINSIKGQLDTPFETGRGWTHDLGPTRQQPLPAELRSLGQEALLYLKILHTEMALGTCISITLKLELVYLPYTY